MSKKENKEEITYKGAFVSVLIVGAIIVGMWAGVYGLFLSRGV